MIKTLQVVKALLIGVSFWLMLMLSASAQASDTRDGLINELSSDLQNRKTVSTAIDALVQSDSDKKRVWLQALLDGKLYARKSDDLVVIAEKVDSGFKIVSASNDEKLGLVGKRDVRKLKINNKLRSKLRSEISLLALRDPDPEIRLAAVERMLQSPDDATLAAIETATAGETNVEVLTLMELASHLHQLDNGNASEQIQAIEAIGTNTRPAVVQRLRTLALSDNTDVSTSANQSLVKIEQRLSLFGIVETLLFGLSLGSVLAMAAIGLAITFGVMGVINMAHGEMIMIGAYTTWAIQQLFPGLIEYSLIAAVPFAFCATFIVGVVIEQLVIRHLYGRPLETLLATFGISLILQQTVRTLVSPQNVPVSNPLWLSGQWYLDPALSVAVNRVVIFILCFAVFIALMLLLRKTNFGLKVRAVSQNRDMARALGARSSRIDAVTFGLGAGIAGVAGVALTQLTNVGPNMGQSYIVDSFMVVVYGGVGNLWGTLLAGLSLGVVNKFLEPWVGAVVAKIIVLLFIILFIQRRPRGLFPQRGRAAGD